MPTSKKRPTRRKKQKPQKVTPGIAEAKAEEKLAENTKEARKNLDAAITKSTPKKPAYKTRAVVDKELEEANKVITELTAKNSSLESKVASLEDEVLSTTSSLKTFKRKHINVTTAKGKIAKELAEAQDCLETAVEDGKSKQKKISNLEKDIVRLSKALKSSEQGRKADNSNLSARISDKIIENQNLTAKINNFINRHWFDRLLTQKTLRKLLQ